MTYLCLKCGEQREQGGFAPMCPGIDGHQLTAGLPTLPAPDRTMWQHGQRIDHYTTLQMQNYARAAVEQRHNAGDKPPQVGLD